MTVVVMAIAMAGRLYNRCPDPVNSKFTTSGKAQKKCNTGGGRF